MTTRRRRTADALQVRMLFERNNRMRHQANAQSVVCAAITFVVLLTMVR